MKTLVEIDEQIAELQLRKKKLMEEEKVAALAKVTDALAELNALGFNYSLDDGGPSRPKSGQRRTGVKKSVLEAIRNAADGIDRAGLISALDGAGDQSLGNSISNALSQLKKSGAIHHDKESGIYTIV